MRIGILTSGGDSPGMNASLYYLKKYLYKHEIIFFKNGFYGLCNNLIINNELINSNIISSSGSIIGSSRYVDFKSNIDHALNVIKQNNIDIIVVIGGNGSFLGAKLLLDKNIKVYFIPATIDNDIQFSQYSIGYLSALNEINQNLLKLHQTFSTHSNICFVETMGRHCSHLSYASSLGYENMFVTNLDQKLSIDDLVNKTMNYYQKYNYGLGIISEYTYNENELSSLINKIKSKCNCDVKYIKIGYVQRGANVCYSDIKFSNTFAFTILKLLSSNIFNVSLYIKDNIVKYSKFNELKSINVLTDLEKEIFKYDVDKN